MNFNKVKFINKLGMKHFDTLMSLFGYKYIYTYILYKHMNLGNMSKLQINLVIVLIVCKTKVSQTIKDMSQF